MRYFLTGLVLALVAICARAGVGSGVSTDHSVTGNVEVTVGLFDVKVKVNGGGAVTATPDIAKGGIEDSPVFYGGNGHEWQIVAGTLWVKKLGTTEWKAMPMPKPNADIAGDFMGGPGDGDDESVGTLPMSLIDAQLP